jgi:hypothetical protein
MSSDNENEVRTPSSNERLDLDIARDAALSLGSGGLSAVEIMRKIEDELRKAAELEASRIRVGAKDSEVSRGTVRSWAQRGA